MNIIIIGAGNVAYHLALFLQQHPSHQLIQIFNRSRKRLEEYPLQLKKKLVTDWRKIFLDADVYLIAVSDQAIEEVGQKLAEIGVKGIVAHTSGASSQEMLNCHLQYGVFYPLQSFSISKTADWSSIPMCIDGNTEQVKNQLYALAKDFSPILHFINDEQRKALHVAAVFVNNFTNHLLTLGQKICNDFDLPFEILQPLIRETFEKAQSIPPIQAQTGPAVREDTATIVKHMTLLEGYDTMQVLYLTFSESIAKVHQLNEKRK